MSTNHQTQVLAHLKRGKTLSQAEANLNSKRTHARYELNEVQA